MKNELAKCLLDALTACKAITSFTSEKSLSEYHSDLLIRSAVERQFEIVLDAVQNHVPPLTEWLETLNL